MEKLSHLLPGLIGEAVSVGEMTGTIQSLAGNRFVNVLLADGVARRLSVEVTMRAYFSRLSGTKEAGTPDTVKRMAVALLERMQEHKAAVIAENKSLVRCKKRRAYVNGRMQKGVDKNTLAAQFATLDACEKGIGEALEALTRAAPFVFGSWEEVRKFFADHGFRFAKSSLALWALGNNISKANPSGVDRRTITSPASESVLGVPAAGEGPGSFCPELLHRHLRDLRVLTTESLSVVKELPSALAADTFYFLLQKDRLLFAKAKEYAATVFVAYIFAPKTAFYHDFTDIIHRIFVMKGRLKMDNNKCAAPYETVVIEFGPQKQKAIELVHTGWMCGTAQRAQAQLRKDQSACDFFFQRVVSGQISLGNEQIKKSRSNASHPIIRLCAKPRAEQIVETPTEVFDFLDKIFHFSHDPCPIDPSVDGLRSKWGTSNFVNPPFGNVYPWVKRALHQAKSTGSSTLFLLLPSVGAYWFKELMGSPYTKWVYCVKGYITFKGHENPFSRSLIFVRITPKKRGAQPVLCYFGSWENIGKHGESNKI